MLPQADIRGDQQIEAPESLDLPVCPMSEELVGCRTDLCWRELFVPIALADFNINIALLLGAHITTLLRLPTHTVDGR
jgi:hypothetical protein